MVSIVMGEGDERSALLPETTGESARASAHQGGVGVGNGFNRWASGKRVAMIAVGAVLGVCGLVGGYMHSTMPGVAPKEGDPDFRRLPPVDFDDKTLLIVVGLPFSGTSALEGLLGTSGVIADLCKADTWQCENTELLQNLGFKSKDADCDCCEDEYTSMSDVTAAEYAYAYRDFANKWWDMSKPVLMDKTPNMLCRHRFVRDAAAALGIPVKFVVLTHHPFSWNSESHPFNEEYYAENLAYAVDILADPSVDSLQVRYEDMAWNMDSVIESVKAFVPAVKNLDPWHSSLSDDSKGDRGMGVSEYFQQEPLEWIVKDLEPSTYAMLCQLGYNEDGECAASAGANESPSGYVETDEYDR
jgi:hypothetical protein